MHTNKVINPSLPSVPTNCHCHLLQRAFDVGWVSSSCHALTAAYDIQSGDLHPHSSNRAYCRWQDLSIPYPRRSALELKIQLPMYGGRVFMNGASKCTIYRTHVLKSVIHPSIHLPTQYYISPTHTSNKGFIRTQGYDRIQTIRINQAHTNSK